MPPRTKPKASKPTDDKLASAFLDLHEPIAEVRPLAELILCLCQNQEPIPPSVMGLLWRVLDRLDADLRGRYEAVGTIIRLPSKRAASDPE